MNAPFASSLTVEELEGRFPEALQRAKEGEEITIVQDGHPVAKLVPAVALDVQEKRREAIQKMREIAGRNRLDGLKIKDLISEGRR